jgi:Bacterial membrane protein YfhO
VDDLQPPIAANQRTDDQARASWREHARAGILLLLLTAALHYDVVFLGRSLDLTNYMNPLDYRPISQNYGSDFVLPEAWSRRNLIPWPNIQDPGATWWQWEPGGEFLKRTFEGGEWPLWDPYIGGGAPAMFNLVAEFFFPPSLAVAVLGGSVALKNVYFLALLWSASFFSFLFLRSHGLTFSTAMFGAIAVLMGGSMNQYLATLIGQPGACLPLALYVTGLMIDSPNGRRAVLVAITYAGIALASFPPVLLGVFGVTTLYVLARLAWSPPGDAPGDRMRVAGQWLCAALLSIGLVSFYYVPAVLIGRSLPFVKAFYQGAGLDAMPLVRAYQLLSPTIAGGVQIYAASALSNTNGPHLPYVGIIVLFAALLARPGPTARSRSIFYSCLAAAILILLKVFGIPPVQWAGGLPLVREIHFAVYFGIPLGFALAYLSALGVDSLIRGSAGASRAIGAALVTVLVTASLRLVLTRDAVLASPHDWYWIRDWMVLNTLAVLATIIVVTGTRVRKLRYPAVLALLALVTAEGLFNNSYPSPRRFDIFKQPPPYVRVLQQATAQTRERVLPFAVLNANLNSAFGIFSLESLMPFNPPRAHELFRRYTGVAPEIFMRGAQRIPPEPLLDRAGIGVVAIRDVFQDLVREAQARGYAETFNDGYLRLFRRTTLPRFFFSSRYRLVSRAAALDAVATVPSREVLLETDPGFPATPDAPGDPSVAVEAYRRNSFVLSVDAPRPGLVYVSDNFFDGWTAAVNGRPAVILPANYAFRAVSVPSGHSRIAFRYRPAGLTFGVALSSVSALTCLAVLMAPSLWPGPRKRRPRHTNRAPLREARIQRPPYQTL